MNPNDELAGAVKFDESVSYQRRIEISELMRMNSFKLLEVTEEQYEKVPKKFDL